MRAFESGLCGEGGEQPATMTAMKMRIKTVCIGKAYASRREIGGYWLLAADLTA
jgi:hypothetical protein